MNLQGKQIFVTGAGGFIGSHLVERLRAMDCTVKAFLSYNSSGSRGALEDLSPKAMDGVTVIHGDIRDRGMIGRSMEDSEVVFHLAALASVPYSLSSPETYVSININGTLNLLEEARRRNIGRVVLVSTSEVYGVPRYLPVDENHPQTARSPYAATKIAAEHLAESYYRSFDFPVTIARPFNTYGPRQSTRAVIPSLITQLLEGRDEIHMGNPHPTRDMNFVADTVEALIRIAESDSTFGQALNIATSVETSIGSIAEQLIRMIRPTARLVVDPARLRAAENNQERICGSSDKLRALAGWHPQHTFEEGLARTVGWFSNRYHSQPRPSVLPIQ
jgi:NAD dependent epimerase/dehydratase